MMKRAFRTPASTFILTAAISPALLSLPVAAGPTGGREYRSSSETDVATREEVRRQARVRQGMDALEAGDRAMHNKDYEEAFRQYRLAADLIPDASNTARLHAHAIHGLCDAACSLAEQRIGEGRYGDADALLRKVLADYDPHCHRATEILKHLEEPDYYNKTITPGFRAKVEQVKQYFIEARGSSSYRPLRSGFQALRTNPES